MFASKSIGEHVVRGVLGLSAYEACFLLFPSHPYASLAVLPVAIFLLRGCPVCWTMGLIQTVASKIRGREAPNACRDGRCVTNIAEEPKNAAS